MEDRTHTLSRRAVLKRGGLVALATFSAPALLTACGSKKKALECNDTSGLSAGEKQGRDALKYVDKSTMPNKNCLNCGLYKAPAKAGECGGCTILKGPIHPEGYCTGWSPKAG